MTRMRHLLLLTALLAGCATSGSGGARYYGTYEVNGTQPLGGAAAEVAFASAAESASITSGNLPFDHPLRLLRAPQPMMSRDDIDHNVVGEVALRIEFSESGSVERMTILNSSKDSLSEAVLAAVRQWRIAPATRAGVAQKVTARQTFKFQTAR
jgi:TonB family protein